MHSLKHEVWPSSVAKPCSEYFTCQSFVQLLKKPKTIPTLSDCLIRSSLSSSNPWISLASISSWTGIPPKDIIL
ncbi:unnamed protein product [Moneuplotes crassus]|uniref:Uncharacterized protein n=1 Tax=Euplotes crassus TaxID=5936 RepID=A0AAD1Y5N0_EUPCR|nr:unnamed protein product [Moneuplotes crassus]